MVEVRIGLHHHHPVRRWQRRNERLCQSHTDIRPANDGDGGLLDGGHGCVHGWVVSIVAESDDGEKEGCEPTEVGCYMHLMGRRVLSRSKERKRGGKVISLASTKEGRASPPRSKRLEAVDEYGLRAP